MGIAQKRRRKSPPPRQRFVAATCIVVSKYLYASRQKSTQLTIARSYRRFSICLYNGTKAESCQAVIVDINTQLLYNRSTGAI
jgi:hypothetical protein